MNRLKFEEAFNELPRRRKEVLLRVLTGETDAEIAQSLKISENAVRKHIERASQTLTESPGRSKRSDLFALVAQYKPELLNRPAGNESIIVTEATIKDVTDKSRQQDWGEAPDVPGFVGRNSELTRMQEWIVSDRCRLIAILGMGGVGKTALSVKVAKAVQGQFDWVIWRSLQYAPAFSDLLAELLQILSNQQETLLEDNLGKQISQLLHYLRTARCLLILDNVEAVMQSGQLAGYYQKGYEAYGELLRRIGETPHQSCLLLCSREKPIEIASLAGEQLPVRALQLGGLFPEEARDIILPAKGLKDSEQDSLSRLVTLYGGNPAALKIVATTIKELFAGNIEHFLKQDILVIGDILEKILKEQLERLSEAEVQMSYWLALYNQPLSPLELQSNIVLSEEIPELLPVLESLLRRSLLEKVIEADTAKFSLPPMVNQYVTNTLMKKTTQLISVEQEEDIETQCFFKELDMVHSLGDHRVGEQGNLAYPQIAKNLNRIGHRNYLDGKLDHAKFYFMLALKFNPHHWSSHYNLGSTFEKLGKFDLAYDHYQAAAEFDDKAAHAAINNLARLRILDQKLEDAIKLILPILDQVEDLTVEAALHKNLGWAYYEQGCYKQAEAHLQRSIEIEVNRASAYCLLAKVQHKQGKEQESLISWQNCLKYESIDEEKGIAWKVPELGLWKLEARQALANQDTEMSESKEVRN
ncbi:MAG: NB-ARC domain-containing protein [Halothece sp.]